MDRARAEALVALLRVYAQPQRLMILSLLREGERSVGAIEAGAGIGQPALSQQLAALRRAGLVGTRRAARQVVYRLAGAEIARAVEAIAALPGGGGQAPLPRPRVSVRPAPNAAVAFARVDGDPQFPG